MGVAVAGFGKRVLSNVAKTHLLDVLDDEAISEKTGLTLAEAQQLRQSQL